MNTYKFQDIFDTASLQKLMDSLSATLQVGLRIRGQNGEPYTKDSDYCSFCRDVIKKSPIGSALCDQSAASLCAFKNPSPYIRHCKSAGLTDAGINIMIDGVHIASMIVGQVRLSEDECSEEEYRKRARSLQLDEEEYLRQIYSIPPITRKRFETILDTLTLLADHLSQLGCKNMYLKSIISSLENQNLLQQQEKNVLETLAEKDSMTGLYNRRKFEDAMSYYSSHQKQPICMISADANFLKLTNDIFGHEAGDLLLKTVADIMSQLTKKDWLVARCGGDEFRVLLPDTTLETAMDYCRRVARNCSKDKSLSLPLSVALGAAQWDNETETLTECFSRADAKMYQNKAALKHELHIPDYIMERLYDRQILNRDTVEFTARLTYDFVSYLGFPQERAREISLAAHYQDIGMAKLPEAYVIRGQSMTEEDASQINAHVTHGYSMARQFEELYKIADMILCSHENWDGSGYPSGMKGYQIPFASRIIRITNCYASWTIPAVTSPFYSKGTAKQKLSENSGAAYDPDLVEKFLNFIQEKLPSADASSEDALSEEVFFEPEEQPEQ